ncbi:hypothetical protein [Streptomyces sp. NPDC050416]|uniref:hypothetical protein n=1 Tax=Streptomyces sp. NPDC050416 TaxID=3365611 RepID=UPI0037B2F71E
MSSRNLRARIDRLAKVLGEPGTNAPVCRFHGTACRLGANWPLPYPGRVDDDLLDLIGDAKRSCGLEVAPHPRDLWATNRHELVPPAELARQKQQFEKLLAAAKARNDQEEAELNAGLDVTTNQQEEA